MSTYLRQTTTVTVSISRYLSRSVTVTGAVTGPGRYGFERIPSLLEVLNAAGGAVPGADLTRVQIVRREGEGKGTTSVDVLNVQRTGNSESLPQLKPGETIVVQSFAGAYAPAPGDGFAVIGEVTRPGIYQAGQASSIWMALARAGGTHAGGRPEPRQDRDHHTRRAAGDGTQSQGRAQAGRAERDAGQAWRHRVRSAHRVECRRQGLGRPDPDAGAHAADIVNIVIIADYLNRQ
jgi:protein involved in polysaccharide export with SLBB domain